jgi:hypothetical protein
MYRFCIACPLIFLGRVTNFDKLIGYRTVAMFKSPRKCELEKSLGESIIAVLTVRLIYLVSLGRVSYRSGSVRLVRPGG